MLFRSHPDNPLGYVYTRREMETIQDFCYGAGLTLIVDSAFAFVSPYGVDTFGPLEPVRNGRRWILIGDTGKIFDLFGVRCGALVASGELVKPLQARLDQLFYRMDALRLNLLESTLGHELWPQAAQQVNRTVAANYSYLAGHIHPRLRAIRPMAGSLAMVEFDGCSGTTDVELAAMLRWVAGVATVPCSYFVFADSCGGALRNRLRIALARPPEVIRRAVENLNAALLDEPSLIAEPANLLRNTRTTEAGASVVPVRLAGRTGPCSPLSNTLKTECGAKCFWAYGGAHRTL